MQLSATPLVLLGSRVACPEKTPTCILKVQLALTDECYHDGKSDIWWHCFHLFRRVESVPLNSEGSFHCIVLSMSQGFLVEIRSFLE